MCVAGVLDLNVLLGWAVLHPGKNSLRRMKSLDRHNKNYFHVKHNLGWSIWGVHKQTVSSRKTFRAIGIYIFSELKWVTYTIKCVTRWSLVLAFEFNDLWLTFDNFCFFSRIFDCFGSNLKMLATSKQFITFDHPNNISPT